ncbi:MAG: NAD(P)/FAD-dependent oxidoreductase [Streptococcaceae bacterium]|jgi:predicted Rossmann fold flavoprotein|nr:NAD(P)/FAD-dependent oxidoreductase [Streptococcaceae bacterium]
MKKFDVIVVGAGPAGMMAAIAAAEAGAKTALIDKNKRVGKKLLLTGGGRCNVTNSAPVDEILANVPGNGRFLHSAFSQFDNQDIIHFFKSRGVALKEEDHGRIFPVSNRSTTIVDALFSRLVELGVSYFPETAMHAILHEKGAILGVKTQENTFLAPAVVLTTGGKTYSKTGSTGDGYRFAESVGHTITRLYPTESALISSEIFITNRTLQGISLRDVRVTTLDARGKAAATHTHDLLFTHVGLSGPAALRSSSTVNQLLHAGAASVTLLLDLFPELSAAALETRILQLLSASNKSVKNALSALSQERLLLFYLAQADISGDSKTLSSRQISQLAQLFKALSIRVSGTAPLEKSFVTGGGVSLKEINPKTLESKLASGLYFAGELLDINGYTGGYNVTCAFVTGHVAGTHAAKGY